MAETFDVNQARAAQDDFCKRKNLPRFAPFDGHCWRCGNNIYRQMQHGSYATGISVEYARSHLVTGCPHCHRSYCD